MDGASVGAADGASSSGSGVVHGQSSDNIKVQVLAISSSLFIGASFIIKKKGLNKVASSSGGVRAGRVPLDGYKRLDEAIPVQPCSGRKVEPIMTYSPSSRTSTASILGSLYFGSLCKSTHR